MKSPILCIFIFKTRGIFHNFKSFFKHKFIPLEKRPGRPWGPRSLIFSGFLGSFPAVKRPNRELDRSPPSSVKLKKEWSCTSAPPICVHGVAKDNFIFTFQKSCHPNSALIKKNPGPPTQLTNRDSIMETNRLKLFLEIITVNCENHMKQVNKLCTQRFLC
jgi:hypothetical protein